jgi:serine/threonine protein kinase
VADFGLSRSISPERTMTGGLGTFQWMVTFRDHSGNLQGTFSVHSLSIQCTFSEHSVMLGLAVQAPEVLGNQRYSERADVYSFGIVLWECVSRKLPYADMNGWQASGSSLHIESSL